MTEKRFTLEISSFSGKHMKFLNVLDNGKRLNSEDIVDLLNEQQATNDYLEEANSRLQIQLGETLRLVDEQQATIRKLQDLCGESDSENAKLRIENKKLKAKLREKEEDEQLYANEILELREANKEFIQFKELGGDY